MEHRLQPVSSQQPVSSRLKPGLQRQGAEVVAAVALFVSVYLAVFLGSAYAAKALGFRHYQWVALFSVICATAATIFAFDGGHWNLGLLVRPATAAADLVRGGLFAAVLILTTDLLLLVTTNMRHVRGSGFPWFDLAIVFLPAALHEELAFRGYIFQKIRQWNRPAAIGVTSLVFALLHLGNRGISVLAVLNLLLAGVLLALAYERSFRLWFPIGIHFVWNVLSGPVLGYDVSGYNAASTLLRTRASGPHWLTGATFGIEGSVWMGVVEVGGICWLTANQMKNAKLKSPHDF